jgi:hypothetical protein
MTDRKVTESNYSARPPLDINHPVGAVVFLRMMSSLAWLDSAFIGKDAKFAPTFLSGAGLADVVTKKFVHTALTPLSWMFCRTLFCPMRPFLRC